MSGGDREEAVWNRLHNIAPPRAKGASSCGGAPTPSAPAQDLFTDNDPATSVKGTGFRDYATALRTLWLTEQPGGRHKQYWTVRAMAERAERHPAFDREGNVGMREAAAVFREWLAQRKARLNERGGDGSGRRRSSSSNSSDDAAALAERAHKAALVGSKANAHAKRNCASDAEFAAHARDDKRRGVQRVRAGAAATGSPFALTAPEFVAVFGGPGEHGYGLQLCSAAAADGAGVNVCACGFDGTHIVQVLHGAAIDTPAARALQSTFPPPARLRAEAHDASNAIARDFTVLGLGKRFPFSTFTVTYDGAAETAIVTANTTSSGAGARSPEKRARRTPSAGNVGGAATQRTLAAFVKVKAGRGEVRHADREPPRAAVDVVDVDVLSDDAVSAGASDDDVVLLDAPHSPVTNGGRRVVAKRRASTDGPTPSRKRARQ